MSFKIKRINPTQSVFNDLYHSIIKMRWREFIGMVFIAFVSLNFLFAYLYSLQPDSLGNKSINFLDYFFFSVQTFSTVGYGNLGPKTLYADIISSIEIFVGMIYLALTTGLIFSKFALPKSKILFTNNLLITNFDGKSAVVFRLANERSNKIMDAQITLHYLYDAKTKEGTFLRRFSKLKLQREHTPFFSLSLIGVHELESGPLADFSEKDYRDKNVEFIISISGIDETYGQSIHSTHMYTHKDLKWGGMFEDIIKIGEDNSREINFNKFHNII